MKKSEVSIKTENNSDDISDFYVKKGLLDAGIPRETVFGIEQGNEQGVTSLTRGLVRVPDFHSHAFRFVVRLPFISDWSLRDKVLKEHGFKAVPKGGIGRVFMSDCFGFKVWFADKSITIYFPSWKRYFVDEARIGYNYAVADLLELLHKLQGIFSCSFAIDGKIRFRVSGQHHGLVHNSLAKMYNRMNEKLHVYDENGELWLLIDNSNPEGFGLNETEGVHPQKAPVDMDDVVAPFFNQLRDTKLLPENILSMLHEVANIQKVQAESSNSISALIDRRFNDFQEKVITPWMAEIKTHLPVQRGAAESLIRVNQKLERDVEIQEETLKTLKAIQSQQPQTDNSIVDAGRIGKHAALPLTISKYDSNKQRRLKLARTYLEQFGWGHGIWGDG